MPPEQLHTAELAVSPVSSPPTYFDRDEVSALAEALARSAGDLAGDFCVVTIPDSGGAASHYPVANGPDAVARIVRVVENVTTEHLNVYFAGALFRSDAITRFKGRTRENIVGVLCIVADFDHGHEPTTRHKRLPLPAVSEVETSTGNFHSHYWLVTPVTVQDAAAVQDRLVKTSGADPAAATVERIWRVPGTWNFPPEKKRTKYNRVPEAVAWSTYPSDPIDFETLKAALPAELTMVTETAVVQQLAETEFDWSQRQREKQEFDEIALTERLNSNKGGDRSETVFGVIRALVDAGFSPEEIKAWLWDRQHTAAMGRYPTERKIQWEVQHVFKKVSSERPVVYVEPGKIEDHLDHCEKILLQSGAGVYQRGGSLVEVGHFPVACGGEIVPELSMIPLNRPRLAGLLADAATFKQRRKTGWAMTDCPLPIAEGYMARAGHWNLPALVGVLNAPTLRPNGSLLTEEGYDHSTGLFLDTRGAVFPTIPSEPTRDDARAALAVLEEIISGFPFATPEAHAVALAAMLSSVVRRVLPTAPMFAIDGTGAGTGKGKLVDAISVIGCGRRATAINEGANEEELEKRLGALFLRGDLAICLDNLSRPLTSDFLCTVITQNPADIRILGQSRAVKLPTNNMLFATGNALLVNGDLYRRTLPCLIDPRVEHPSERTFTFCPVERAIAGRGKYVAAALTVLRAYHVAGHPSQGGTTFGSFEEWTRVVRDTLLWLGHADPVSLIKPQADDAAREKLRDMMQAWLRVFGLQARQALGAVCRARSNSPDYMVLADALCAVTGSVLPTPQKLGSYLTRQQRKVVDGLRFMSEYDSHAKGHRWFLEAV